MIKGPILYLLEISSLFLKDILHGHVMTDMWFGMHLVVQCLSPEIWTLGVTDTSPVAFSHQKLLQKFP